MTVRMTPPTRVFRGRRISGPTRRPTRRHGETPLTEARRQRHRVKRTLRHPIRGDHLHPKPPSRLPRSPTWRAEARQPRMRPRKKPTSPPWWAPLKTNLPVPTSASGWLEESSWPLLRPRPCAYGPLQVVDGKTYAAAVNRNQVRIVSVPAPRGEIVDRNETVLAGDVPEQEILLSRATAARQTPPLSGKLQRSSARRPRRSKRTLPIPSTASTRRSRFSTTRRLAGRVPRRAPVRLSGVTLQEVSNVLSPEPEQRDRRGHGSARLCQPDFRPELKANPHAGYSQASQLGQSGSGNEYEQYLRGSRARRLSRSTRKGRGRDPPQDGPNPG